MSLIKKENIVIVIGEYEKDGQTKKQYRTIGEMVTMQGDDGQPYQFGKLWGASGVTEIKIYQQDQPNQNAPQNNAQPQQGGYNQQPQQGGYNQPHQPNNGYPQR